MAHASPLRRLHQEAEAALAPYGPPGEKPDQTVELVETFGELDLEYAAIRKACILLDQPNRGVLELTGADRLDFLNRMVTQELRKLGPFQVARAFWLNRKGRIDADLRIIDLPGRTLLDLDVHAAERTLNGLSAFIVSEDVVIRDLTQETHRLALHGPTSALLLGQIAQFAGGAEASGPALPDLVPGRACVVRILGHDCIIDRDDSTGEIGMELIVPVNAAVEIYRHFIESGSDPDHNGTETPPAPGPKAFGSRVRLRPAGWHAFNIARIEAGRPLYNIDFGPSSLPAETGVLDDRVSFTKGCYLGQEVVARMHSRGHSKQALVALKLNRDIDPVTTEPRQPVTGAHLFPAPPPGAPSPTDPGDPVGVITSSCISPMLGGTPICFAHVKQDAMTPGTELVVEAGMATLRATVQPTLRFWKRG